MTEITDMPQLASILFGPDRDEAFARLLDGPPVQPAKYFDGSDVWLVTRYNDIMTVLTDRRFSNDPTKQSHLNAAAAAGLPDDVAPYFVHTFGFYDPPDHTRLRKLVTREFTPRRVRDLRPRIQQITDELLDGIAGADEVDLIEHFALPLPLQVICELLGVPADRRQQWHDWSRALTAPDLEQVAAGARGLVNHLSDLIAAKQTTPDDDLLSALGRTQEADGDRLSTEELISISLSVLIGGHETTVSLIGNGTLLLLSHPQVLGHLRADLDRIPAAVEELLRLGGPADIGVMRYTLEPVEIAGVTIPAGEPVQVLYAAGNRDPQRFDDPHRLTPDRTANAHLAFGHGIHYCLGAALARAEGDIAFRSLLSRFPDLALGVPADELTWQPGIARSLRALPVRPAG